jgi:hypothetical protein
VLCNAALYIVAAWVVIQVADLAIDAGVIRWPLRDVFVAAFLSFPVALVLSWFYDVTRRGIVRTPPVGADDSFDEPLHKRDYLLFALFAAAWTDEPEYQTMVEEIESDMAAQLERVRAMEANGELEPIPDIGFNPTTSNDLRR